MYGLLVNRYNASSNMTLKRSYYINGGVRKFKSSRVQGILVNGYNAV